MGGDVHIDHGKLKIFHNHCPHGLFGVSPVEAVDEKPAGGTDVIFISGIIFGNNFFDVVVPDLDHAFFGAFSVDNDFERDQVYLFFCQHAQFRNSDTGGKEELDDGDVAEYGFLLTCCAGRLFSSVHGGYEGLNGGFRDGAWEGLRFPEFQMDFVKRVHGKDFFAHKVVEESFYRSNFPFGGFGLVCFVEG